MVTSDATVIDLTLPANQLLNPPKLYSLSAVAIKKSTSI